MIHAVKFFLWLLGLLPAGMPYRLSRLGAGLWMRLSPVKRHTAERNLERCYPEMPPDERAAIVRESFVHYLCSVLETGHNWYWPVEKLQARCDGIVNEEMFREALTGDRGLLVLAPHFGAWEYLGMYLQKYPGIAILYKPPGNPALEKALLERRRRGGANMIAANAAGLRRLYAHLKAGGGAGVLAADRAGDLGIALAQPSDATLAALDAHDEVDHAQHQGQGQHDQSGQHADDQGSANTLQGLQQHILTDLVGTEYVIGLSPGRHHPDYKRQSQQRGPDGPAGPRLARYEVPSGGRDLQRPAAQRENARKKTTICKVVERFWLRPSAASLR